MTRIRVFLVLLGLALICSACEALDIFPDLDSVTGEPPLGSFREQWYSKHLEAMNEPAMSDLPGETYRFTWLRTFHPPISVRISCHEERCTLVAKRLNGAGGYEPGEIDYEAERQFDPIAWGRLQALLKVAQFWQPQPPIGRGGMDGAQWIFEGTRDGQYHLWDVWSPGKQKALRPYRKLCEHMLRLSGIPIESGTRY